MRILLAALLVAAPFSHAAPAPHPEPNWEATLDRVVQGVVAISVSATRPFDTEGASTGWATGFVVDAKRGIILSNRHVVQAGPIVAEALFLDHEEVDLKPIYRDPAHDFGFFRFEPAALRYMPLVELPLAPDAARVGDPIRVVGNDAGEKLSILEGTLARLDRDAPTYGGDSYNDFNTFYYQAASNTSGGSSGSPVVNQKGQVIALNAGGSTTAASSFYLPLHAITRALALIQQGLPVPRGTLQVVFQHVPFDELRRLGLTAATESAVRAARPGGVGMLVVAQIVPGGPAANVLELGDIVIEVDGQLLTAFDPLEKLLDSKVGRDVALRIERSGTTISLEVRVDDLHHLSPSSYLEFGGGIVHELSLQQARNHQMPARGVYVAGSGYVFAHAGIPAGSILTQLAGQPVPSLAKFIEVLSGLPDGARVPVRSVLPGSAMANELDVLTVDRRFFPARLCTREDELGRWPCVELSPPPPSQAAAPVHTTFPPVSEAPASALANSFVMVDCDIPYITDGLQGESFRGVGVVVDAERGLVVVDRDTVPATLAEVRVTFAGSVDLPATVVWLHPAHGLAMIRYDPKLLADTDVRSARLETRALKVGDKLHLVGLDSSTSVVSAETRVERIEPVTLALPNPPRFRESNIELIDIADSTPTLGGVLTDDKGGVVALWTSISTQAGGAPRAFFGGMPAEIVQEMLDPIRAGKLPEWRSLGVEWQAMTLVQARARGLPADEAEALERTPQRKREVLTVRRVVAGTPAEALLREGDLLVTVSGQHGLTLREIELAAREPAVRLGIVRDGAPREIIVPTFEMDGRGTTHVAGWAGAMLQDPPPSLAQQRGADPGGVYVSFLWFGSPADRHGLQATQRILAVDGVKVKDLDAFLVAVQGRHDRQSLRLDTVDLQGRPSVATLKLDLVYWPTFEVALGPEGWRRTER